MEVITCKSCGKLFNYIQGDRICPNCKKALDEKFTEVKRYVYDHPGVEMNELSQAMEVSIRQIKRWIREERLSFSDDSPIGIECENCGTTIKTGRFCKNCKDKLSNGLREAAGLNKKITSAVTNKRSATENKMRFLE